MFNLNYIEYSLLEKDKIKVESLYNKAFPVEERCPHSILITKSKKKKGQYLVIYDHNLFVGFIYVITFKDIVYIYYFAIEEDLRGKGYGTKVLTDIKKMFTNQRLILMAETLDSSANNYQERLMRNEFYKKNGFIYLGYTIMEFTVTYDMLGLESAPVSKLEYKELICYYFGKSFYNFIYRKNTDIEK